MLRSYRPPSPPSPPPPSSSPGPRPPPPSTFILPLICLSSFEIQSRHLALPIAPALSKREADAVVLAASLKLQPWRRRRRCCVPRRWRWRVWIGHPAPAEREADAVLSATCLTVEMRRRHTQIGASGAVVPPSHALVKAIFLTSDVEVLRTAS